MTVDISEVEQLTHPMPKLMQQSANGSLQQNLTHQPLTNLRAYYRSKLFTPTAGINPLVTCAAGLLTCIDYLQQLTNPINSRELYQELLHEIRAFETQAQTQGYRSELILVSRYILCATLDEIILNTSWGAQSEWSNYNLLTTFHSETWGGDRFFLILERLSADVPLHIDALELIYLCINLGYLGKYRSIENGQDKLNKISEELYQVIRWHRGEIKKTLLLDESPDKTSDPHKKIENNGPLPVWLSCLFVALIIFTLFLIYDAILGNYTVSLYQQFSSILLWT